MKKINLDMWYGDVYNPDFHTVDCYFNDLTSTYSGNIYNSDGRPIGDYTSTDSAYIAKFFGINFR